MSARVIHACAVCDSAEGELFVCGRCESEVYCSTECQRLAWKVHKKVCGKSASTAKTGADAAASVAKDLSDSIEALFEKESPSTRRNTESVKRPCDAATAGDTGAGDVAAGTPKTDASLKLGDASVATSSSAPARDVPAGVVAVGVPVIAYLRLQDDSKSKLPLGGCCEAVHDEVATIRFDVGGAQQIPLDWVSEARGVPVHPRARDGRQTSVSSGAGEQCKEGAATDNEPQEDEECEDEEDEEAARERLLREKAEEERRHKLLKLGKTIQTRKKHRIKKEENESRRNHAQQVRAEEELRCKAETEERRREEEQRRRERQENQRQLQEEQAATRRMEEERRKEIAERKRQRDEEKALKMKQDMERELAMQREEKAKAEAERKRREDAERLAQERRRSEEEQRRKIEIERREQAHQRMVKEKEADERRRQRSLGRKKGMSWRTEVEKVARAREEEMQAPDLTPELRAKLESRKVQVEYAARKRLGMEEEINVPEKFVNHGYEDKKQQLLEHGRKKKEALAQTAKERLQGTHFEGESDEDTDEMEDFMMSHRRQKELIARGQLKNREKPLKVHQAELKETPRQQRGAATEKAMEHVEQHAEPKEVKHHRKGAATEKAVEQAENDAEKLWRSERLKQLLHQKRQKVMAKAEETDGEEDEEERQEVKNIYLERLRQTRKSAVADVKEEDVQEQQQGEDGNADGDAQAGNAENLHEEHAENGNEHDDKANDEEELLGNVEQDAERDDHEEGEHDAYEHDRNQDEGVESEEEEHNMVEDADAAMPSHQTVLGSSPSRAVPRPVVPDDSDSDDDEEDNTTFDSLMRNLKMQIGRPARPKQQKKSVGEAKEAEEAEEADVVVRSGSDALGDQRERSEAAQRTMELLEARRMAELAVESKSRRKKRNNWVDKHCGRDSVRRQMDEQLLAEEERAARNVNNKAMSQKK